MGMSESPQLVGMGSKMILFNSMTKLNRKNVQSLSPILHIKWYLNYQKSIFLTSTMVVGGVVQTIPRPRHEQALRQAIDDHPTSWKNQAGAS